MKGIEVFPPFKEFYKLMKRMSLFAASFIFAAVFAASAIAQPGAGKIGWIDTAAFQDDKEGITRYINALKALKAEMAPRNKELADIQAKGISLAEEFDKLSKSTVPVDRNVLATKQDEIQKLQREYEFKSKELEAAAQKRGAEVLGPIQSDIFKVLQDWAKTKGYNVVFDIAALANDKMNALIVLDPSVDVTKDFVTFYNARPPSTAGTSVPK